MYSSPGTDIAPAHFGGNYKAARRPLRAGGRLEDGVVYGNIFELRITDAEFALVIPGSDKLSEFSQRGVRFWQKSFQILKKRGNPPEKHPGIPVIVFGSNIFLRKLQLGFLRESPHGKHREPFFFDRFTRSFDAPAPRPPPPLTPTNHHHSPPSATHIHI